VDAIGGGLAATIGQRAGCNQQEGGMWFVKIRHAFEVAHKLQLQLQWERQRHCRTKTSHSSEDNTALALTLVGARGQIAARVVVKEAKWLEVEACR
jgi:hypothetical protein